MSKKFPDEEVLQRPVHVAILKTTHLEELANKGRFPHKEYTIPMPTKAKLPVKMPKALPKIPSPFADLAARGNQMRRETALKVRLKVIHDSVPPLEKDKIPPCDSCVTKACCFVFMVNITKEEYEAGLYGDYAVKLDPEHVKAIGQGHIAKISTMGVSLSEITSPSYFLEGAMGQPCPFLLNNGDCGIYDVRPVTCRVYSCVDDPRITQGMRDGTEEF